MLQLSFFARIFWISTNFGAAMSHPRTSIHCAPVRCGIQVNENHKLSEIFKDYNRGWKQEEPQFEQCRMDFISKSKTSAIIGFW